MPRLIHEMANQDPATSSVNELHSRKRNDRGYIKFACISDIQFATPATVKEKIAILLASLMVRFKLIVVDVSVTVLVPSLIWDCITKKSQKKGKLPEVIFGV